MSRAYDSEARSPGGQSAGEDKGDRSPRSTSVFDLKDGGGNAKSDLDETRFR